VEIERAAADLRREPGAEVVEALHLDLAKQEGIDKLHAAISSRPIDVLTANAGRGLGHAFLDQDLARIRDVIDANVTGTTCLLHKLGNDMRRRNQGRILITGSIAGFTPGSFQVVYKASKAYLNSLSFALREELRDTEIGVTCLMPSATETEVFKRADMLDTKVGSGEKDDPGMVAPRLSTS
jgi:short-subunit dehydrogenase